MANTTVYIMEAANLFCGDDDPTNSKHLVLEELKLPDLEETFSDHNPGGSLGPSVEWGVGMSKLMPTFKLKGFDMAVLRLFGLGSGERKKYTAYGVVRDKKSGDLIEAKAIMEGRIGKITGDTFTRGGAMSHDYAINEVTHYEFWFNGVEEYYWNFWTNTFRNGAGDQNARANQIMRING